MLPDKGKNEQEQQLVMEAVSRRTKIMQALSNGTAWFLEAGRLLCEAVNSGDYLVLGYENQNDYFRSEFNIGLSTAHNLMDVWELFHSLPSENVLKAGYTRLTRLVPIVRQADRPELEEWVEKAVVLPGPAFNDAIKEARGQIASDNCDHDFKTILVCKKCGYKITKDN